MSQAISLMVSQKPEYRFLFPDSSPETICQPFIKNVLSNPQALGNNATLEVEIDASERLMVQVNNSFNAIATNGSCFILIQNGSEEKPTFGSSDSVALLKKGVKVSKILSKH